MDDNLFALCCQQAPSIDLNQSLYGVSLHYAAVPSIDWTTRSESNLLARCLVDASGEPILAASSIGLLHPETHRWLVRLCRAGHEQIPSFLNPQLKALEESSKLTVNANLLNSLGSCFELSDFGRATFYVDRPDRFFGQPLCNLLDSHWLAFRIARAHVVKAREDAQPKEETPLE